LPVGRNSINRLVFVILGCLVLFSASSVFALERPRIGVLRFTNNTHAYWWQASTASELQEMLVNELAATKAFSVLERPELYSLLEQKFTDAVLVENRTKSKTAKTKGARYLILATVSAFEENTNGSGNSLSFPGLASGEEQNKAYVVVDVKIIDAEAGAVIESRSIEATSSGGPLTGRAGNVSRLSGSLSKREKTPVGCAIRNSILEITEYLECSLITKEEECTKKYAAMGTKRKEKNSTLTW
jgi:curli biogenesis system outer membrane secretion channel CsgG